MSDANNPFGFAAPAAAALPGSPSAAGGDNSRLQSVSEGSYGLPPQPSASRRASVYDAGDAGAAAKAAADAAAVAVAREARAASPLRAQPWLVAARGLLIGAAAFGAIALFLIAISPALPIFRAVTTPAAESSTGNCQSLIVPVTAAVSLPGDLPRPIWVNEIVGTVGGLRHTYLQCNTFDETPFSATFTYAQWLAGVDNSPPLQAFVRTVFDGVIVLEFVVAVAVLTLLLTLVLVVRTVRAIDAGRAVPARAILVTGCGGCGLPCDATDPCAPVGLLAAVLFLTVLVALPASASSSALGAFLLASALRTYNLSFALESGFVVFAAGAALAFFALVLVVLARAAYREHVYSAVVTSGACCGSLRPDTNEGFAAVIVENAAADWGAPKAAMPWDRRPAA